MANRILRDWTDSKTISGLSWQGEVLFTRLIMKADDYGNFHADPQMIKSLCFPRKDDIRSAEIDRWLKELEAAEIIRTYPAKGDVFLHIINFGQEQRLRNTKRKYPPEPEHFASAGENLPQVAASCRELRPETKRNEEETKMKMNSEIPSPPPEIIPDRNRLGGYIASNATSYELIQQQNDKNRVKTNDENRERVMLDIEFVGQLTRYGYRTEAEQNAVMDAYTNRRKQLGKTSDNETEYRKFFWSWIKFYKPEATPQAKQLQQQANNDYLESLKRLRNGNR